MSLRRVYLNNAATSWPKPPSVARAVADFMERGGSNWSRGAASEGDKASMGIVFDLRERLAELFGAEDSSLVTFAPNVTEALNVVIKGWLRPGMSVVTTSMEHNSVMRPLRAMERRGVDLRVVPCDECGYLSVDTLARTLGEKNFDMMVMSCASNVCGSVQPFAAAAEVCRARGVRLVLDTAQAAGAMRIDIGELGASALCFTGHKGLMGPQGTGGIVWDAAFARECAPLVEGGTGSFSHEERQPDAMPDKFEAGTPNLPGLAGLLAALEFIEAEGVSRIATRERELASMLTEGARRIEGLSLVGVDESRPRTSVVAMTFANIDCSRAAEILSSEHGIESRPGLHCAPCAHRTLDTYPAGALRLSPGYFTTREDIETAIAALRDATRR